MGVILMHLSLFQLPRAQQFIQMYLNPHLISTPIDERRLLSPLSLLNCDFLFWKSGYFYGLSFLIFSFLFTKYLILPQALKVAL